MPKFKLKFTRVEYKAFEMGLEADSLEDAQEEADDIDVDDDDWEVVNANEDCTVTPKENDQ